MTDGRIRLPARHPPQNRPLELGRVPAQLVLGHWQQHLHRAADVRSNGRFVMPFVLGAKGSRWAWRNGRWDSVEHFKRVQRLWAIWVRSS